jgi:ketosteroid isomerase-like protein
MKNFLNLLFCYLCILSFTLVAQASVVPYSEQNQNYVKSILSQNHKMVAKHFNVEGELLLQAQPTIAGATNIQSYFKALFEEFDIEQYERDPSEILDMGEKSAEIGRYSFKLRNAKGEVRVLAGSYLSVWSKAKSSEPKIDIELWNFDHHIEFSHELQFNHVPATIRAFEAHLPINSAASIEMAAYASLIKDSVLLRDGEVLSQLYTNDGVILRNSNPRIEGISDIKHYWQKHAQEIVSLEGLEQRTTKLEQLEKYIIEHAAHIAIWRSGTNSGVNTGKHIRIWERQKDGRIKIRILASAYDK